MPDRPCYKAYVNIDEQRPHLKMDLLISRNAIILILLNRFKWALIAKHLLLIP